MPLYQIYHSLPLTLDQRQALARSITDLHCTTFTTPSFFVHIKFWAQDVDDGTSFMGGKPTTTTSNRIVGTLRSSPARSKSDYDALASRIEDAWYDMINGSPETAEQHHTRHETNPRRLLMVSFTPMLSMREGGMVLPEAGQEQGWLREQMPYIREMGQRGEDFADIVREVEQRDDLQRLLTG